MATPAVFENGEWYIVFANLIRFVGGEDIRENGKITLKIYGREVTFAEGSSVAITKDGEFELGAKVFRGREGQLYIPVDGACKAFGMKWAYAKRNNLMNEFEIVSLYKQKDKYIRKVKSSKYYRFIITLDPVPI